MVFLHERQREVHLERAELFQGGARLRVEVTAPQIIPEEIPALPLHEGRERRIAGDRFRLLGAPVLDEGLREGPTIAHAIAVPQVNAEEFGADRPADHVADVVEEGPEIEHCGHDAARLSDGPLVVVGPPVQVPIERVLNAALQGVEEHSHQEAEHNLAAESPARLRKEPV